MFGEALAVLLWDVVAVRLLVVAVAGRVALLLVRDRTLFLVLGVVDDVVERLALKIRTFSERATLVELPDSLHLK